MGWKTPKLTADSVSNYTKALENYFKNDIKIDQRNRFVSKMMDHYADSVDKHIECKSSEEMCAAFEDFNKLDKNVREKFKIISMDVKSLYPSMR